MADTDKTVQGHYGRSGLLDRIIAALKEAGVDPAKPRVEDLHPFDQLHGMGILGTRAHAERAGLRPGLRVLDLGCGIGGSSRFLAAERGCRVTGVDLTPDYVEVARELTRRCGIEDIAYQVGNALALDFADASFDHVWCHNVTMNIPDKEGLAREVARVLRRGGRFSCVELAQGPGGPPAYPMPWAMEASASFLATPEEMRTAVEGAGLRVLEQLDLTDEVVAHTQELRARARRGEPPTQRNAVVMGDDFVDRARNSAAGLAERRLLDQFLLAERI